MYRKWHKHIVSNPEKISPLPSKMRKMKHNLHLHSTENYYVIPKFQLSVFVSYRVTNKGLSLQESNSCFYHSIKTAVQLCQQYTVTIQVLGFQTKQAIPHLTSRPLSGISLPWAALTNAANRRYLSLCFSLHLKAQKNYLPYR